MRRVLAGAAALALLSAGVLPAVATASPAAQPTEQTVQQTDELPHPLEDKRRAARQEALAEVLTGAATAEKRGASTVVKVGKTSTKDKKDQYVELKREKVDKIFVVLTEFGNERHPQYPDKDTAPNVPGPQRFDGPLHNQIPEPDRTKDNTTIWQKDFSRQYFQDLYFSTKSGANSVANYYDKQSSGRYSVTGSVTNWVKVKYNEARYGRSNGFPCGGNVCNNSEQLVRDAVTQWVADQTAAGRTPAQIKAELATFDEWDRYDFDGDGEFNEPDGYIDHFQVVHSGGDQADGDPWQGEDAIWSHRGYAFKNYNTGPGNNKLGGSLIGDTGIWVGDYTMQPENGGVSVFAHEYGHDLGLPDHYDTSGGGQNGVNWWSLMGQTRVGELNEAPGTRANELSAWDKLQLGWLDYEIGVAGQEKTFELGPHEYNSRKAQGLVVVLPDVEKTFNYGTPFAGSKMWWSDKGNDLDHTMTAPLNLTGKTSASLSLKARFDIEEDFDYLYVEASNEDGSWTQLDGVVDGKPFIRDSGDAPAISGSSAGKWVDVQVPLNAYAGKNTKLRFAYRTDGGLALQGFFADSLVVTADGAPVLEDGAETAGPWTLKGFRSTAGTEKKVFDQFYVASNRTYESYGKYNKTGPYRFSFPDKPDWVEHFPYQDGLLVSLWDTSHLDNNTSEHPGEGLILPIDANPAPIYNLEGRPWSATVAGYDAPFGRQKSDSFTLHVNGKASYVRGQAAQPVFDDTKPFWYAETPNTGVKVPAAGVGLRVVSQAGTSMKVKLFKTK
ncbi:M6 family metalloprotease domain-containing protein [Lentzea tibetensis]|uniref:M6 family metalloprotease domain-containing protein n=1 Tax=Lentzea tibetensis TaxID=2591470 RepID=A0A563EX71_9PSEU|nr:immune inhibitor A domain-containing protein [Lentzea tibetensis]TWP52300.1 M6 family metalloprotease domain-containing protein [Lentzea tibetensis]